MLTLGVIADTHIPDRLKTLPPQIFDIFHGVTAILHAGDVSAPRVLAELAQIAPVYAVAGNRDIGLGLPLDRVLEFDGVTIGLTHGHGGWGSYIAEKFAYLARGYQKERFIQIARSRFDGAGVRAIVFGHTHRPVNEWRDGVLMFNPGSFGPDYYSPNNGPAVGLLRIDRSTLMAGIVCLD